MSVVGERTKMKYSLGNRVLIKVVSVFKDEGMIDFQILKKLDEEDSNVKGTKNKQRKKFEDDII